MRIAPLMQICVLVHRRGFAGERGIRANNHFNDQVGKKLELSTRGTGTPSGDGSMNGTFMQIRRTHQFAFAAAAEIAD